MSIAADEGEQEKMEGKDLFFLCYSIMEPRRPFQVFFLLA